MVFFSCSKNTEKSLMLGTFKIIRNDSIHDFLIRDESFQMRIYNNTNIKNEFCKLNWISNELYYYNVINPETKYDSLLFKVKINKISKDTFYESIYPEKLGNKTLRKMVKLSDTLGEEFSKLKIEYGGSG